MNAPWVCGEWADTLAYVGLSWLAPRDRAIGSQRLLMMQDIAREFLPNEHAILGFTQLISIFFHTAHGSFG